MAIIVTDSVRVRGKELERYIREWRNRYFTGSWMSVNPPPSLEEFIKRKQANLRGQSHADA